MTPAQVAHIMALVDHYGSAIMLHDFAETTRARAAVEAALRDAPQAEGWVMVPVDPTPEMLAAILEPIKWAGGKDAYRAMLAARPSAPTAVEPDEQRYQLLRRGQHWSVIDGVGDILRGDDLDAAVDSILAARLTKDTP